MKTTTFKLERIEKVQRTTAISLEETIEEQNREREVEAALENVRFRSLAAHTSDEFSDVIKVVYEKLEELGLHATSLSLNTFIDHSNDTELYIYGKGADGFHLIQFRLPYADNVISNDRVATVKRGVSFFTQTFGK